MENLIYSSSKESAGKCKNLNETYETNCKDYIETKCRPLAEFLANCTATDINGDNKRKIYYFCLLLEQVEGLRNQNHVGYLAFAQSLVK